MSGKKELRCKIITISNEMSWIVFVQSSTAAKPSSATSLFQVFHYIFIFLYTLSIIHVFILPVQSVPFNHPL